MRIILLLFNIFLYPGTVFQAPGHFPGDRLPGVLTISYVINPPTLFSNILELNFYIIYWKNSDGLEKIGARFRDSENP